MRSNAYKIKAPIAEMALDVCKKKQALASALESIASIARHSIDNMGHCDGCAAIERLAKAALEGR